MGIQMVLKIQSNFLNILWPFLICILISTPSSLSIPVKGRESSGVVLLLGKHKQEHQCLVRALWHEARGEPEEGIRAVMSVIYNRKNHKNFPSTFCGVILQDKQFSAFNSDKGLATRDLKPIREFDRLAYTKVAYIANEAVLGGFKPVLGPSVLYYAHVRIENKWTRRFNRVIVLGNHSFYKEI